VPLLGIELATTLIRASPPLVRFSSYTLRAALH
jgi:hypothetical protein